MEETTKVKWKKMYTLLLVINTIYILVFYLITKSFS